METVRQSVPRTAHPNQQALGLQFPMEPRFRRLNHEVFSFSIDWDINCGVRFVARRGAARRGGGPTKQNNPRLEQSVPPNKNLRANQKYKKFEDPRRIVW